MSTKKKRKKRKRLMASFLERKPPENLMLAWGPSVQNFADKLGCTTHDLWLALFACNKSNAAFDEQMRRYLKERKDA